jgi:hypothetical protein
MDRIEKNPDVDMADGTEDPPLHSWIAEAALERWETLERVHSKRKGRERIRGSGD